MNPSPAYQTLTHHATGEAVRWDGHMTDGVGATYGPVPLAFLSATTDELLLCGNRGSFRFPRAAITKLKRGGFYPWMFSSVRIHHDVPNVPRELQFKPVGVPPREVLARLKSLGYPVP